MSEFRKRFNSSNRCCNNRAVVAFSPLEQMRSPIACPKRLAACPQVRRNLSLFETRRDPLARTRPCVAESTSLLAYSNRSVFDDATKGNPHMKHLDLYARRDPQLAPYLLREVDIEWKRTCRKVGFVVWVAIATALLLFDQRLSSEALHYLKAYVELYQVELEAMDDDANVRRSKLVRILKLAKTSNEATGKWGPAETASTVSILRESQVPDDQVMPSRSNRPSST